jgi:cytochrome o ubiquinol oxidase subunit III
MSEHTAASVANETNDKTLFGFWIYLMTDCVLFASLFATYIVLLPGTNGGPSSSDIFNLPFVLAETLILLTSSFTSGLAMLAAEQRLKRRALLLLGITAALGLAFLAMEVNEFHKLAAEGNSWHRSGFLSAFFTLVGTHGLHITAGLIWLTVLCQKLWSRGFTRTNLRRLSMFSMFWHFLDIIWIFIFSIVYMIGVL